MLHYHYLVGIDLLTPLSSSLFSTIHYLYKINPIFRLLRTYEFTPLCEELLELIHFPLQTKPQNLTHKRLAQFIIISEPRHVFLEEVIYRVTHTLNNYFDLLDKTDYSTGGMLHTAHKIGYKLHTMTGPGVWTNCIRKVLNEHDVHFKFIDEDGRYSATNFMIGKKFGTPSSWEDYEGSLKSIAHSKK